MSIMSSAAIGHSGNGGLANHIRETTIYNPGDFVPWHFMPGIIVASFFASLTGTLLTVELLHRKQLGRSFISRVHLFACAVSMGLIGIWCMHFIGNRSIILGNGDTRMQLIYSPGFTVLSCALPVVGLTFAFYIAEMQIRSFLWRRLLDIVTGLIAGLSIVGMHYVGNLGTINYSLVYPARYIVAACIIAVGDCIVALALFFYFKERWISVFWKRLVCAIILAVAVCGMHFTASIGCTYQLKRVSNTTATQRNTSVIVASLLCFVAAISVLGVLFYTHRRNKILAGRAQQVMVACAYFDDEGNIMVTNEGTLPCQAIGKRFALQKFDDEFGVHHPVFRWIWRVSHDWGSVTDLVVRMRSHLRRHDPYMGKVTSSSSVTTLYDEESYQDATTLFREAYCVAAADLAEALHQPLDGIGVLYDEVLGTGLLSNGKKAAQSPGERAGSSPTAFEKGQLLFFTRKLNAHGRDHFTAAGYRFAPFNRVEALIARTMQISTNSLNIQLQRLRDYAQRTTYPPPPKQGVYLVCLAALARPRGSFLVLGLKEQQEELPDVRLTADNLTPYQMNYLKQFNGWTAEKVVKGIEAKDKNRNGLSNEELTFVLMLRDALASLGRTLGDDWFLDLIFCAQPILMRYGATKAQMKARTTVFGFTRLLDIHQGSVKIPQSLSLVNLDFMKLRQVYFPACNDHGRIRHEVHAEFGPLLTKDGEVQENEDRRFSVAKALNKRNPLRRPSSRTSHESGIFKTESCSERRLVTPEEASYESGTLSSGPKQMWGGILATTDTVIVETSKTNSALELKSMGPHVTATAATHQKDPPTYVDALYSQAKSHPSQMPRL